MAAEVVVRQVEVDELSAYNAAKMITFQEVPTESPAWRQWRLDAHIPGRSWCASDGADIVATLRTLPRRLSVPDGLGGTRDLDVDALTGVTVAGTHRRRGLLRRMLTESLDAARDRGDPASILVAAEWPIYGRFGYWPTSQWAAGHVDRRRRGAHVRVPATGGLRRVDLASLATTAAELFAGARTGRAGQIDRPASYWDRATNPDLQGGGPAPSAAGLGVAILHEGPDGVDGFVRWHPKDSFGYLSGGTIVVDDLFATGQDAYTALWAYLLGLDVVDEIHFEHRPTDEPVRWLLQDGRAWQPTEILDAMWLRLLDVPAALSRRGYAVADRLVIEVVDDDVGGFAAGRYLLEAGPDGGHCRRETSRSPDLAVSQRALSAVYLGQPSLRAQQLAGLVDEHTVGAVRRLDLMFGTPLLPWLATEF